MAAPVVEAVGLTKQYGSRLAVNAVAFAVAPGECLGFLGRPPADDGIGLHLESRLLCQ